MSLTYLDASTIIYLVEATGAFHTAVVGHMASLDVDPRARLVTSQISWLECRTRPLREKNSRVLSIYDSFFAADRLTLVDVTAAVIERATFLRARYGFKTPDAIHLATAVEAGAERFLTGDATLRRCTEIAVDVLVG